MEYNLFFLVVLAVPGTTLGMGTSLHKTNRRHKQPFGPWLRHKQGRPSSRAVPKQASKSKLDGQGTSLPAWKLGIGNCTLPANAQHTLRTPAHTRTTCTPTSDRVLAHLAAIASSLRLFAWSPDHGSQSLLNRPPARPAFTHANRRPPTTYTLRPRSPSHLESPALSASHVVLPPPPPLLTPLSPYLVPPPLPTTTTTTTYSPSRLLATRHPLASREPRPPRFSCCRPPVSNSPSGAAIALMSSRLASRPILHLDVHRMRYTHAPGTTGCCKSGFRA